MKTAIGVSAAFDQAVEYDRDNPLLAIERAETEALWPDVAGRDVLDLGAGHAYYACRARDRGARRVTAADRSAAMLRGVGVPRVVADAAALPLRTASVDVVIAALVLSYVDRPRTLREAARVLRPGGCLLVSELHAVGVARGGWRRTFRGPAGETVAVEAPPPAPERLLEEIEAAGFVRDVVRETAVDRRLEPHFRRAGRRDLEELLGMPLLVHVVARRHGSEVVR